MHLEASARPITLTFEAKLHVSIHYIIESQLNIFIDFSSFFREIKISYSSISLSSDNCKINLSSVFSGCLHNSYSIENNSCNFSLSWPTEEGFMQFRCKISGKKPHMKLLLYD